MRLIDADKAKAELLRIARDIHDCCGFYDGLKAGYQSAADRLDTIPTAEKECDISKYIQYFLDENNLEIGEEFMLTNENGRHIHPDKTFFFNGNPTSSRDILISKDEERFCPNILLGLLTGFYGVQKKPWQPEIGDVYFYVAVDEGRNKGVIHNETLFNKNNIKFLLLKKSGKYYKSYFEAEKHLKEDYEYLTGE